MQAPHLKAPHLKAEWKALRRSREEQGNDSLAVIHQGVIVGVLESWDVGDEEGAPLCGRWLSLGKPESVTFEQMAWCEGDEHPVVQIELGWTRWRSRANVTLGRDGVLVCAVEPGIFPY